MPHHHTPNLLTNFSALLKLASLPVAGNILGALAAEFIALTKRKLSLALHASAGVLLAVVAVELMPKALQQAPPWLVIASFVAGGAVFISLDHFLENLRTRTGKQANASGPWTVYVSVAIDLISDGVMVGIGSLVSARLGLVLALGQALADVPQALATMALLQENTPRAKRIAIMALLAVPLYAGVTFGYFFLRAASHSVQFAILAFTAGLLTTLAVEEIVPQAHERGESHAAAAVFVLAFGAFIAITSYL